MKPFFIFSLVIVIAVTSDELLSVNIVIRHADRAATSGWATPESEEIFFRGNGELTDDGIDNAFKQGLDFKERYVKSGFVDERYLPNEARIPEVEITDVFNQMYVRSSSVNRCLMSAAAFTSALFKQTSKNHSVVPPIHTKDGENDGTPDNTGNRLFISHTLYDGRSLQVPLLTCADAWDDVISRMNLISTVAVNRQSVIQMMMEQWPPACSSINPALFDAIVSELPNPLINMPDDYKSCAEGPAKEFMYQNIELLAGAGDHYDENRIKRVAGLLTTELLTNFAAVANCATESCPDQPKMRIYYTHDVNVLAIAQVFGVLDIFQGITPAFSSALIFETRRMANETYIIQKNGENADFVDTNNCASDCSLAAVTAAASPLAITSQIPCS